MGKTFCVFTNGNLFDEYKVKTSEAAINAYMEEVELSVFEVDIQKLLAAVQAAAGVPVLQDGRGVAVVEGVSYQNYQALARTFGLSIETFLV